MKTKLLIVALVITATTGLASTGLISAGNQIGYVYSDGLYTQSNFLSSLGFGIASGTAFVFDEKLPGTVGGYGDTTRDVAEITNYPGQLKYSFSISALLWSISYIAGWDAIAEVSRDTTVAQALAGLTSITIKPIIGRARPRLRNGPYHFEPPTSADDWQSMPSGDAALAFAWASAIDARLNNLPVSILSYAVASGVCWSRVNKRAHWVSDVLLGALIGTLYGRTCGSFISVSSADSTNRTGTFRLTPYIEPAKGYVGFQLSL